MPVTAPGWALALYFDFAIMGKTFESGPELKAAGQAQSREQLTWQASLHGSMSKGAGIYVQHLLSWKRSEILPVITLLSVETARVMSSSCSIVFFVAVSAITWGSLARKICRAKNEAREETNRECLTENNQLNKENLKFKVWEVKPDTTKPSSPKPNKVAQCLISNSKFLPLNKTFFASASMNKTGNQNRFYDFTESGDTQFLTVIMSSLLACVSCTQTQAWHVEGPLQTSSHRLKEIYLLWQSKIFTECIYMKQISPKVIADLKSSMHYLWKVSVWLKSRSKRKIVIKQLHSGGGADYKFIERSHGMHVLICMHMSVALVIIRQSPGRTS